MQYRNAVVGAETEIQPTASYHNTDAEIYELNAPSEFLRISKHMKTS